MNFQEKPENQPENPEKIALVMKGEEILTVSGGETALKLLAQAEKAGVKIKTDPEKTAKALDLKGAGSIPQEVYFLIGEVLNFLSRSELKLSGEWVRGGET